jgi:nitroreductase
MDVLDTMKGRRVQRSYAQQPVELEKLSAIVDAGRHAMSARNLQPWNFIVIRDRATLKQLGELCSTGKFVAEAPAAIAILKDTNNARWADIDCGQAVMNMANAAWSMSLGTCWVGNFEGDKIAHLLGAPAGWAIFTVLPFGYQDEKNPPQAKPLKPRAELVHFERFGNHQA